MRKFVNKKKVFKNKENEMKKKKKRNEKGYNLVDIII